MMYVLLSLVLGAIFALMMFNWETKENTLLTVIGGVVAFLFWGIINYNLMPVLNLFRYTEIWWELMFTMALAAVIHDFSNYETSFWRWIVISGVFITFLLIGLFSSPMTNSRHYNELLKVEEVSYDNFATDVNVIPVEKMVVADYKLARKVVEDRLEEDPGLGSRCMVGRMTMQNLTGSFTINGGKTLTFDDDLVWVAPLEHSGFWKWLSNDVTPGYMLVYANDPTRNFLITEVNGQPLSLRYIEGAFFGDDIERHIRTSGYATQGITEHNFEIDGNGRPYWILCNYSPTIGRGAPDAKGVITVDIQNGKVEQYRIEDAPAWIDHIQPENLVTKQINWWGAFKLGWWNSLFAQRDVQKATDGMVLVYSEGQSYWYTGIRSAGGDTATSGFMLVNTRTKEARYYRVSGVNEKEAERIVEDQNFAKAANYDATAPVLYNVRGIPTYFMTLKGESGNVTGYAFMAVTNRQAVGVGSSKREAENNYLQALRRTSNDAIADGPVVEIETVKLTVRDITLENNTYYVLFVEVPGKEFTGSSEFYRELRWTKPGHQVEVTYSDGNSDIIPLDSFDNLNFNF